MDGETIISNRVFVRRLIAVIVIGLLFILSVYCGYLFFRAHYKPHSSSPPAGERRSWCVAKPGIPDNVLQKNIDYACGYVDCSIIQEGGSCYLPKDDISYASVSMNLYYHRAGGNREDCDFDGSGEIVYEDPSFGSCVFPS